MKKIMILAVIIPAALYLAAGCSKKSPAGPSAVNSQTMTLTAAVNTPSFTATATAQVATPTITPTSTKSITLMVELSDRHIFPSYVRFLVTAQYQGGQGIEDATVVIRDLTNAVVYYIPCDNSGSGTYTLMAAQGAVYSAGHVYRAEITIGGVTYQCQAAAPGNIQLVNNGSRLTWDNDGNRDAVAVEAPSTATFINQSENYGSTVDSPFDIPQAYFGIYGAGQYFYQVQLLHDDPDAFTSQGISGGFFDLYQDALIYFNYTPPTATATDTPDVTDTVTPTVTQTGTDTATATITPTGTLTGTVTETDTVSETATISPTFTVTMTATALGTPLIDASLRSISGADSDVQVIVSVNNLPAPDATVSVESINPPAFTYYVPYIGPYGSQSNYKGTYAFQPETDYLIHVAIAGQTFTAAGQTPSMPSMSANGLFVTFGAIHPRLDVAILYNPTSNTVFYSGMNMDPVNPFAISPSVYTVPGNYTSLCYMVNQIYMNADVFPGTDPLSVISMQSDELSVYAK